MNSPNNPRPLSDHERRVLAHLLSPSFVGADELRQQISSAKVVRHWGDDESPSIDIDVPEGPPRAPIGDGPAPIRAEVLDSQGDYTGELLLWLSGGAISALEYAWITDEEPHDLPEVSSIRVSVAPAP